MNGKNETKESLLNLMLYQHSQQTSQAFESHLVSLLKNIEEQQAQYDKRHSVCIKFHFGSGTPYYDFDTQEVSIPYNTNKTGLDYYKHIVHELAHAKQDIKNYNTQEEYSTNYTSTQQTLITVSRSLYPPQATDENGIHYTDYLCNYNEMLARNEETQALIRAYHSRKNKPDCFANEQKQWLKTFQAQINIMQSVSLSGIISTYTKYFVDITRKNYTPVPEQPLSAMQMMKFLIKHGIKPWIQELSEAKRLVKQMKPIIEQRQHMTADPNIERQDIQNRETYHQTQNKELKEFAKALNIDIIDFPPENVTQIIKTTHFEQSYNSLSSLTKQYENVSLYIPKENEKTVYLFLSSPATQPNSEQNEFECNEEHISSSNNLAYDSNNIQPNDIVYDNEER